MGYTHYWYRPAEIDRDSFVGIVSDFMRMQEPLKAAGVLLADGCGEGDAIISFDEVCFNGPENCGHPKNHEISIPWPSPAAGGVQSNSNAIDGSWFAGATIEHRCCNGDCSYETFDFPRVLADKHTRYAGGLYFDCTKTAFRPYDLAVNVFLIVAKKHLKGNVLIRSDGEEAHWFDAKMLCAAHLGYGLEFALTDARPMEEAEKPAAPAQPRTYESAAEAAKRIREALKAKFPGVVFSVRSKTYSGGSSINVSWTDGPTVERVKPITSSAEDVSYDQFGEILSGGNRYVFCDRETSPALRAKAMKIAVERYGIPNIDPDRLDYNDRRHFSTVLNEMEGAKPAAPAKAQKVATAPTAPQKDTAEPAPVADMKGPDGPATKSQLFYLYCLTKQNTRGLNITKRRASELIELAKDGSDVRGMFA